jgi:hypothetical protein
MQRIEAAQAFRQTGTEKFSTNFIIGNFRNKYINASN